MTQILNNFARRSAPRCALIKKFVTVFTLAILFCSPLLAGGGPENLVLVVNADSSSSKLLANHYVNLRRIPGNHVIYLSGIDEGEEMISEKDFKEKILGPVLQTIIRRKIGAGIDYVVYSSGFPTQIKITDARARLIEVAEEQGKPIPQGSRRVYGAIASINSMTYYASSVMNDDPSFMLLDSNWYMRSRTNNLLQSPFIGPLQDQFKSAIGKIEGDEIDGGISDLKKLAGAHPNQIAVAYNIARAYGKKSNALEAANWLTRATKIGWSYRGFTRSDMAFDSIANSEPFKSVLSKIPDEEFKYLPTSSFHNRYIWGRNGSINGDRSQGKMFLLSTMLAVTRNMGMSEKDALQSLKRSVGSDNSPPRGIVFFSDISDVRARTRKPGFQDAVDRLRNSGFDTLVKNSIVPSDLTVAGAVLGRAGVDWDASGSKISPGAIVETLTSYGGCMDIKGHTKVTEFLKWGAAGSSGTVIEPFAIQAKFPHPMIQVHYTRGCSLAEAFYQSVYGPYQLLIVGDALCQPFAKPPSFDVTGLNEKQVIEAPVQTEIKYGSNVPVKSLELYIDGVLVARHPAIEQLTIDSTKLADGFHEIRLVAIAGNIIESKAHKIFPVFVRNDGHRVDLSAAKTNYDVDQEIEFELTSNFGDQIDIFHNGRPVGTRKGKTGTVKIAASTLGRGPVTLSAFAYESGEPEKQVQSVPVELEIIGPLSDEVPITSAKLKKQLAK